VPELSHSMLRAPTYGLISRRGSLRYLPSGARWSSKAVSSSLPGETPASEYSSTEIDDCNSRYRGILQICETEEKGRGLFASRKLTPNDLVMSARALSVNSRQCSHSIQNGWDRHVVMDLPAILINHSCDANVGVRDNDLGAFDFFALRDIAKGEELVWDYNASEWEISTQFQCACGSPRCRGMLRGFKHDGEHVRDTYGPFYASYLKKDEQ
jgi:hypothetical protein